MATFRFQGPFAGTARGHAIFSVPKRHHRPWHDRLTKEFPRDHVSGAHRANRIRHEFGQLSDREKTLEYLCKSCPTDKSGY